MEKGNIIDLSIYRNRHTNTQTKSQLSISQELEQAIQNLILQLREQGPLSQSK